MSKKISRQEAVLALKELFDYEGHKESKQVIVVEHDDKTTFMIDKRYLEMYEVIHKLQDFFSDKVIDKGQCRIENITLVWTTFFIEDRK